MMNNNTIDDIQEYVDNIQFLSPNEPITTQGMMRIINQINNSITMLESIVGAGEHKINMWSQNISYSKNDLVLYFKTEQKQIDPTVGKRTFVFILSSMTDRNSSIPNYDLVDGIPDFSKTNWSLINPLSYLLQNLNGMIDVVKDIFNNLLNEHISQMHGISSGSDVKESLLRKDFLNLKTKSINGVYSTTLPNSDGVLNTDEYRYQRYSDGVMECFVKWSLDSRANQILSIQDDKYFFQRSPILDESDKYIFSQKYTEDDLFSVVLKNKEYFTGLRLGTNIFHTKIEFKEPFLNDEYCLFFDTYGDGDFVFGYDKDDIESQTEPTYDAIISQPMILNKSANGFDIVVPVHTYFNSMKKYNIGVPWNNKFRLQAIGRFR